MPPLRRSSTTTKQHDYNERNFFFLPAVTTTSGRISGDFLRLLTYCLTAKQQTTSHARASSIHPPRHSLQRQKLWWRHYILVCVPVDLAVEVLRLGVNIDNGVVVHSCQPGYETELAVVAVSEIHQCVARIEMVRTYQMGIYHSRNGKTLVRTKWGSAHSRTRETGYQCTRLRHCAAPTSSGCLLWNTRSVSSGGEACIREGQASPQSCQR